jgi:hypothetical protein
MFFLLLSILQAEELSLYSWVSQQSEIEDLSQFQNTTIPRVFLSRTWNQSTAKAYSQALFSKPSLLSLLNKYQIPHKALPSLDSSTKHNIILLKQGSSRTQLLYKNKELNLIFFAYKESSFSVDLDPFSSSRFTSIIQEIDTLLSTCESKQVLEKDFYENPTAWKGEKCFFGDLVISYQPIESYPLQAVFYARY